ncbi:MAG: SAM-dependent methyltransferase, partial [Candidatus Binataceae bacterium]
MHSISSTTNLLDLARRIARELRRGRVIVDGDLQRLKRLYIELIGLMPEDERTRLQNLAAPLEPSEADVKARLNRRIAHRETSDSVPLEDLLLISDFPPASRIIDKLFPNGRVLASAISVDFDDPKGLLSVGQYRAILSVFDRITRDSPAARLAYTVERHHDHVTFHHPVQVHGGVARATIDVAQLEKRDDFAAALLSEIENSVAERETAALDRDFVSYDQSCVWNFNRAFWRFLRVWENVTGKSYQRALPKGKAESNHQEFIDAAAARFAGHVRELEREGAIAAADELWICEKAPGSGGFIAGMLDYLRARHPAYYRRMRVVLADISADVLSIAANELKRRGHLPCPAEGPRIFFWPLGGGRGPDLEGGELIEEPPRQRFLYIRHANFFDQLPARLFAKIGSRYYELYVQAVIDPERLSKIEARHRLTLADLRAVIDETTDLTALDPELKARYIHFWSEIWLAVKFNESYRPIERLAEAHPDGAEIERIFAGLDDVRFVTSDAAIATMRRDLELLHPEYGYACFTDIFLQRAAEFKERWIELAKYDNGVWVGANGVLMAHLLGREGYQCGYFPVELTLGAPSAVYTMTLSRRHAAPFTVSPALIQELTGIAADEVSAIGLTGLPRRVRNNLRDLPSLLEQVEPDLDWGRRTFDDSLDLTRLMRELYYHSPPAAGENSLFLKMAALIGEVLDSNRGRGVRVEVDLSTNDLRALEDFLDHRPVADLPMELIRIGAANDEALELRLRLPTIAHKLKHGEFLMLAEVDLPRGQSLEQLRRRILQFQAHVDAVSLTSGRMADPRFLRSRETLAVPLLQMVHPDQIVITLEMCDRLASDLERDIHGAEKQGVHNIFVVTGDFEREANWRLDSVHGIQLADRMRNGEGADGRVLERRSRVIIAGALTWGAIPDLESRIDRDVRLKAQAGADLLFTQPVYDLRLALQMLDLIAALGLDREVHIVAEILPLLSLETIRSLSQTPGIAAPPGMVAAYEQIDRNAAEFCHELDQQKLDPDRGAELFASRIFANVADIPGYEG